MGNSVMWLWILGTIDLFFSLFDFLMVFWGNGVLYAILGVFMLFAAISLLRSSRLLQKLHEEEVMQWKKICAELNIPEKWSR